MKSKLSKIEADALVEIFRIKYEGTDWECRIPKEHIKAAKKLFPKDYNKKRKLFNFKTIDPSKYKTEYINFLVKESGWHQERIIDILFTIGNLTGDI